MDPNMIILNQKITIENMEETIAMLNDNIAVKFNLPNTEIDVFINSKGGSLTGGFAFIEFMKLNKNVKYNCYAFEAKSIAFDIFQNCNKRYITKQTTLLQHNATLRFEGSFDELEYYYENYFEKERDINIRLDKYVAKKMNISYGEYMKKIKNEWILNDYKEMLEVGLADEVVVISNLHYLLQ